VSEAAESTGAQLVLDVLADEGVEIVFGYPGGANMPLYDALYDHPIEHVLVRHEAAAAFAAGGYARSSGRVGVCFATSGPGATNLVTGLLDAQMDSVPVVAITGQVRTALMGTDGFQEADVTSIMGPVTKRSVCVRDVADLERVVRAAFRVARGPRPGPVLVDIPSDILKAKCPRMDLFAARPVPATSERPSDAAIDETIALLRAAKRPVAIVGGGARSANAVYLFRELTAMLELPHTATINGLGCATPGDPRFLGMLGMHGWKAANLAVNSADLVLALGMRFDDRVTGKPDRFARHAKIVHADVDASEFGKIIPVTVALRGDLRQTLERLVRRLGREEMPRFSGWAAEAAALGGALPADRAPHGALSATDVLDAFFAVAPDDTIVATDVGQHQMWAAQRQRAIHPRNFITSAGLGSMGFGLPAAIGAQFAHPERTVVAVCGDGGFQMSIAELATLRRHELPVKILLIDNQRLGMVRQWQELFYEKRYSHTDLSDNPDFVMVASGYGIRAERVEDMGELRDAIERFLAAKEPALLHCACFPAENVWPLIPPGATVEDAMHEAPQPEAIVA
jgi:acetolactate synthase-1/2/3 large subunit